uniref:Acid ceramidase N-terminal domain-containing protein n=1 Tax=Cyanistes caeruleus TaxID=156563 RepID=A0A8C0VQU9_CYACU
IGAVSAGMLAAQPSVALSPLLAVEAAVLERFPPARPSSSSSGGGAVPLRWLPVLRHFQPAFLRSAVRRIIDVPKWVHHIIQPIAAELEPFMPQPFAGEIAGMCKALGISLGDGILLNFAYESTAFCTSIVVQDDRGNIYHGRNLDYDFVDILSKITLDVQFIKGGQVRSGVGVAGWCSGKNGTAL